MKTLPVFALALAGLLSAAAASFQDLPAPVQNTIRGQAGNARVDRVEIMRRDGATNYAVTFRPEGGKPRRLLVDAQGHVLNAEQHPSQAQPQARVPLSAASKVTFNDLPAPVQNTLRAYARDAKIQDIDKGTLQGRTVYQAAFKREGANVELRVAEDGSLIKDDVNQRFLSGIGAQGPPAAAGRSPESQTRQGESPGSGPSR